MRYAANALLILGLVVAGACAVVAHLSRTVLDEDAFSARIVAALDRPAVAAFVAQEIADGVVAANKDLTGVKPVIGVFSQAIVKSAPFRALARRAARDAHALLFSKGAEKVMLAVPDVGVLLRGALETINPEVARRVPSDLRTVIETQLNGAIASKVLAVLRVAERIHLAARWGVIVGLLLVGLALVVSPTRRQTLLDAAIGLAGVALMIALLVPLGRAAATGAVAEPALRPVVGELWTTFAGGLRTWALALGIVAGMLVAAVAAVLEPARVRELAERGLRELTGRQPTVPRELLRIACLLLLGGFAVAAPLDTVGALAVTGGVVLLVLTVFEVVSIVAPQRAAASGDPVPLHFNPTASVAAGGVVLLTAGLGALALAPRLRPAPEVAVAETALECNGAAALCGRRLDEVTLAGAHNAMGSADNPHWMFPNQDVAFTHLLDRGVRALLIDVMHGHPVEDRIKTDFQSEEQRAKYEKAIGPEGFAAAMRVRDRMVGEGGADGLYMCHGFCELGATPFDTALAQLHGWLIAHPAEVVLVVIEDRATRAEIGAAFERSGLSALVYPGPWRRPLPTLGELIRLNQRLVVMGENEGDSTSWYGPAYQVMTETPYTFHKPDDFSCRRNRGDEKNPMFLMNHWIETTPAPRPSNAELVNTEQVLVERARECRRVRGRLPNVLAVDFAGIGDVVGAAAVLNGLATLAPEDATVKAVQRK